MRNATTRILILSMSAALVWGCGSSTTETAPSVTVTGDVAVMAGMTITLTATTADGTDASYAWASSKEGVATVDDAGVVTGVAEGTAVITATGADTGAAGSWGVHVYIDAAGTVRVVVSGDVSVAIGATITLGAQTVGGTDASYTWKSSAEGVATVDAGGVVTGIAAGDAVITATGADSGESGSWGVAVIDDMMSMAVVTITGGLSITEGLTLQLTAATTGGTDSAYAWTSDDEAVAMVDDMGLVTGTGQGEAMITATGAETGAAAMHGVVVIALGVDTPFEELWSGSGHADKEAEAFKHWDDEDPPEIGTSCAKCHSTPGFQDFLGEDGTEAGVVDNPAPIGTTITCVACHNAAALALDTVEFPSGAIVEDLGAEARCMTCHQGRQSGVSVDEYLYVDKGVLDDDVVPVDDEGKPTLSFRNIHYFPAGATLYGAIAHGGYQYEDKAYDWKFAHVDGYDKCINCHDPHTLEVKVDECGTCHTGVTDLEGLKDVRMYGSLKDYDGDGDMAEGIYHEIDTLKDDLYAAILDYAKNTVGTPIVFDAGSYPYWFEDSDEDGMADVDGEGDKVRYTQFTARLIKSTYNLQMAKKDPGTFAHNAKYIIQLLVDSIEDLGGDVSGYARDDAGHFAGSTEPFRHWDDPEDEGMVSASCSRCHSATGLPFYNQTGTTVPEPTANGFMCSTCHPKLSEFDIQLEVEDATFPSGLVVDSGSNTANLCISCHQGRESKANVDIAIEMSGAADDDTVPVDLEGKGLLSFKNIHYFAAGATLFGTEAQGAYEYDGKHYDGRFSHVAAFLNCNDCHDVHTQEVKVATCGECHTGADSLEALHDIRMAGSFVDYDGDGQDKGIWGEIDTLRDLLYEALKVYSSANSLGILYDSHAYPYFFVDDDGDGIADKGTDGKSIRYNGFFTPRSLKGAYNYQYSLKDPGAFAHNAKYLIKLLYDSIEDLGGDVSGLSRNDGAHFDTTSDAFRHWDFDPAEPDDTGFVPTSCARCHTPTGFSEYLETGEIAANQPVSYGLTCEACHMGSDFATGAPLKAVASVTFPSGVTVSNTDNDTSFLCMTCHQGRESMASIDTATTGMALDAVPLDGEGKPALGFKNVHYLSAGASLYGGEAMVGYQYTGKTYAGKFLHGNSAMAPATCSFCHEVEGAKHAFEPQITTEGCFCHSEATPGDVDTIRKDRLTDYDGDMDNTESLHAEIEALAAALYAEIQTYATAHGGSVVYEGHTYPYFFKDDGNGVVDPGEAIYPNGYKNWTPRMLRAAHNFQISQKEHGAWAHNTDYTVQLLIDSIDDLGGDVSGFNRP